MQWIYYDYYTDRWTKKIKKVGQNNGAQQTVWRSDNKASFESAWPLRKPDW